MARHQVTDPSLRAAPDELTPIALHDDDWMVTAAVEAAPPLTASAVDQLRRIFAPATTPRESAAGSNVRRPAAVPERRAA
jgi:hypothetical protein